MKLPPSRGTGLDSSNTPDKFPFTSSGTEEYSPRKLGSQSRQNGNPKAKIVIPIVHTVPVAIGATAVLRNVVPRPATVHPEVPAPFSTLSRNEKNGYLLTLSESCI
jgi:hypothetical protein